MKESTGIILKKKLGLQNIAVVKISRILELSAMTYYVWFDSHRPTFPITNYTVKKLPAISALFRGIKGFKKPVKFTPPFFIEDFNGSLKSANFITIDLCGRFLQDTRIFENNIKSHFFCNLKEYLQLDDLTGSKGLSNFTKQTRKTRNKTTGAENILAKVIGVELEPNINSVTFKWRTKPTKIYPKNYKFKQVNIDTHQMEPNPSRLYELHIRILDFFDWLDTNPNLKEVTEQDIKEILDVAYIQVWSNDPSFHWQGINYWMSQLDGSISPTNIKPKRWDKYHGDGEAFVSKHLAGLLNGIKFWRNPMASMLTKKLKDKGYIK